MVLRLSCGEGVRACKQTRDIILLQLTQLNSNVNLPLLCAVCCHHRSNAVTSGTAVCSHTMDLDTNSCHMISIQLLQGSSGGEARPSAAAFTVGVCTPEYDPNGADLYAHQTMHGWVRNSYYVVLHA